MPRLDDRERLHALHTSGLLRKDVTCRFDHLVFTAATLLRADIAQLNVLTAEMQYTTAGWPPGGHIDRPVEDSGCRTVVERQQTVAIPDVLQDPIMCTKSWATEHRGYMGTPVLHREQVIGTLCVLTHEVREWGYLDHQALEGLAHLVSLSLEV